MNSYQGAQLDALGDATRRAILARLLGGPLPVGKLAGDFTVSRPAISQHLRVLKQANLVMDQTQGTRRLYQLNPQGFDSLREYFDQFWNHALQAFKKKIEQDIQKSAKGAVRTSPHNQETVAPHPFCAITETEEQ